MRRVLAAVMPAAAAIAVIGAAGCAADGARAVSPRAFHRPAASELPAAMDASSAEAAVPAPAPALATAAPVVAVADAAEGSASSEPAEASAAAAHGRAEEVRLRRELATAADPTSAAIELGASLAAAEQFVEARVVLETALARQRTPLLRIAHAGVLRDLGQRHLAKAELRTLRGEIGAAALSPGLLWELAEVEWLEGEASAATSTLREMLDVHAGDAWPEAHRAEIDALATQLQRGGRPSRVPVRDLLGNLRGAPLASDRIDALERLCRVEPAAAQQQESVAARAVAVALGDDAGPVRARALQLAPIDLPAAPALGEAALEDPDALVRAVAARRAASWLGARAATVLFAALSRETDPDAFVAEHEALAAVAGIPDPVARDAVQTAAARSEVVARWRARTLP